jgi:RHS repeat-associated protein
LTETRAGVTTTYTYDANGNRASKAAGGTTETYTVDDADKLTNIKVGTTTIKSYGYDAAGRTTSVVSSAGTTTLAYDYEGRISTITYPSSATNSFTYNGLDTRVGKVDSAGTTTYRRDGDYVLAPVLEAGGTKFTPGISRRTGTTSAFYHADRLGSNTRQTSTAQGSIASRQYDAFGNLAATSGTWTGPFGFAGEWCYQEDADSGLQLLGHRYYDSSTGRFLSRDKKKEGKNWYCYANSNPIKFVDPLGEWVVTVGGGGQFLIPLLSGSTGVGLTIGDQGVGITGSAGIGYGGGAAETLRTALGLQYQLGYDNGSQPNGVSKGSAAGVMVGPASVEVAIDESGNASGFNLGYGAGDGGGTYYEKRRQVSLIFFKWQDLDTLRDWWNNFENGIGGAIGGQFGL